MNGLASHFASYLGVRQVLEIAGVCLNRYAPGTRGASQNGTAFFHGARGVEGLDLRKGAHLVADKVRQAPRCGMCEKNSGSAVETEPHGGTSAKGDEKRAISSG